MVSRRGSLWIDVELPATATATGRNVLRSTALRIRQPLPRSGLIGCG
jgi:hypothetical protein